jgi:hypothetical protein
MHEIGWVGPPDVPGVQAKPDATSEEGIPDWVKPVPSQYGLAVLHNALCYVLGSGGLVLDAMVFLQHLFWGYLGILKTLLEGRV